jgi:hypothetical protein
MLVLGLGLAWYDPFTLLFYASYAAVGGILALRRPRNPIGWLVVVAAFGFAGTTVPLNLDVAGLQDGSGPWRDFLLAWVSSWASQATFGSFVALTLMFPSGMLPVGRWRKPAIALLVACTLSTILGALAPTITVNPDGGFVSVPFPNRLSPLSGAWAALPFDSLFLVSIVSLVIGVVAMLLRYRRSTGIERLQLRWLVAAMAFVVLAITFGLSSLLFVGDEIGLLVWIPAIVAYPTIPAAIYIAITRYRLYEIDRVVSRTIGWAVVTAALASVFVGTIIGLQALLAPFTNNNTLAVAGSTLLAAALFQPLRAWVQRAVDRRFNRARVDAQRAIDGFGAHLRDEVDLDALHGRLLVAAGATVQPNGAGLWLRQRTEPG